MRCINPGRFGMRRSVQILNVLLFVIALQAATAADAPKKIVSTTTTTVARPVAGPVRPEVDAAVVLPRLVRGSEAALLAYRETHPGFIATNRFDTLVYRFSGTPSGALSGASVAERLIGGENRVQSYSFTRAGDGIEVMLDAGGMGALVASVKAVPGGFEASGDGWARTYSKSPKGVLSITAVDSGGTSTEEWKSSGKEALRITLDSTLSATGGFGVPEKGRVVYTERLKSDTTGAQDVVMTIWAEKDDVRLRTEGVEPVNEVYASGLGSCLSNESALENFVLVDIVLGEGRRLTPLFAWLTFRFKPK